MALSEIPDDELACRAEKHDWPKLIPGKPLPRNFRSEFADPARRNGVYLITETCGLCGKKRSRLTLPRGVYDTSAVYWYEDPPHWKRLAQALGVTKTDCKAEVYQRLLPAIAEAARGG